MPAARHDLAIAVSIGAGAVAVAAAVAVGAVPAQASWRAPVEGAPVTRAFDLGSNPFESGRHRGVDFAARAGEAVRAPCAGQVVVAGRVGTSGRVVTIRCGAWRVSQMPLATIVVRMGDHVRRGARLGTAAPSRAHAGLHLGVRREGDRFGYVDPLRFLAARRFPPPLAGGRRSPPIRVSRPPRLGPAPRAARRATKPLRRAAPAGHPAPLNPFPSVPSLVPAGSSPVPGSSSAAGSSPAAGSGSSAAGSNPSAAGSRLVRLPWPAWLGAALMLAGLGFRWRVTLRARGRIVGGRAAEGVP